MHRQTASYISTIILVTFLLGTVIAQAATPTVTTWLQPGSLTETASYIFWKEGATYFVKDGETGKIESGADASAVIIAAITNKTQGGVFHLKTGHYDLNAEILFEQGMGFCTSSGIQWILEGEGTGTVLHQETSNTNAITVKNGTNVVIRNLQIKMGASAGYGIQGRKDGDVQEMSFDGGGIYNIDVYDGNPSYNLVRLTNFWYMRNEQWHLATATSGVVPVFLESNTTITSYGNSYFGSIHIYCEGSNGALLNYTGSNSGKGLNLLTLEDWNIMGDTTASTTGLVIGNCVRYNTLTSIDVESFDIGVQIGAYANNWQPYGNVFVGGYIYANTVGIQTNEYSYNNRFTGVNIDGGITDIVENSGWIGNFWEDLDLQNSVMSNPNGYGVFEGGAGQNKWFSWTKSFTGVTNNTAFNIPNLLGTPDQYGIMARNTNEGIMWVSAINATHATVLSDTDTTLSFTLWVAYPQ